MTRLKSKSYWILTGFLLLFALLLSFTILSNKYINQESTLEKIQTKLSQLIGGDVKLHRIKLYLLPRPRVAIRQSSFSVAGMAKGTVASLVISPKILPLFAGELRGARIDIITPDIELAANKRSEHETTDEKFYSIESLREKLRAVISLVSSKTPGFVIVVENGRLNTSGEKKDVLEFREINARIDLPKDKIGMDIRCNSEFWKRISLQGDISHAKDKFTVALETLELGYPQLDLSGKLDILKSSQPGSRNLALELKARHVDVNAARQVAALANAGTVPAVNAVFDIVRGGVIPAIKFTSRGSSPRDLGALENMIIEGRMQKGDIFVPGIGLDLKEVQGDVIISEGILRGQNLQARLENSRATRGTLKLGFADKNAPFHLDLAVSADLAQLPPILKRLIDNDTFQKELNLVENLQGKATGRLILGESLDAIKATVEVSGMDLSADHQRLPYALQVSDGRFSFKNDIIALKNVNGKMGKSSFEDLSLQFDLKRAADLKVKAVTSTLNMEEIIPWVSTFDALKAKMKAIDTAKGVVNLSALSLRGLPSSTKNWHFQTTGNLTNLTIKSSRLPGPLKVPGGYFNLTPQKIAFNDLQAGLPDSALKVSGVITGDIKGIDALDLSFNGKIGPDAAAWVTARFNLPRRFELKPPVSVSEGRLTWNNRRVTGFSGNLTLQQGLELSGDVLIGPEELRIKKLNIRDLESQAAIKLTGARRVYDLSFDGNLNESTLNRLIPDNRFLKGWIKGNLEAHILPDKPGESTVKGNLRAKDFVLPWEPEITININTLDVDADGGNLHVNSANISLADNRLDLEGDVNFLPRGFVLDMEISAEAIHLDRIKPIIDAVKTEDDANADPTRRVTPVRGALDLKANNLTYGGFTWRPFYADISIRGNTAIVAVNEGILCGIATPGTLRISPQAINIDIKPVAKDTDLQSSLYCLLDESASVEGTFSLESSLTAQTTGDALVRSLNGNIEFSATPGRFYGGRTHGILVKIFRLLNIIDVFKGTLPDINQAGFGFNSMHGAADIKDGTLIINELSIDGHDMGIAGYGSIDLVDRQYKDMTLLVAPLKTVDYIVDKIPFIGNVLGGHLISVPVKIGGPLHNPHVTKFSASAVGTRLTGIMERTLKLPFQILEPALVDNRKEGKEKN